MAGLPEIRAIVDWANDGFFEPFDGQSLPNLIPTALSWAALDRAVFNTGSISVGGEVTDYGIQYMRDVTGTNVFGGWKIGATAAGSVDDIPVSPSTTYRATAWVRGVSGSYGSVSMVFRAVDQAGNTLASQSSITLTASWQKISFTFTTGVSATHVQLWFFKNNSALDITFDTTGIMVTATSATVNYFNTGTTYAPYEDVTPDVVSAQWDSQTDKKSLIPTEGQLTLTLDNTARKYSPRYASSPLFGAFQHGLRVRIEIKRASTGAWVTMWSGWITEYQPHPSVTHGDSLTVITATQGVFNMDAVPLQTDIQENVTFDEVLPSLLYSGWYPASDPHVFVLGKSHLGEDTWLPAQADLIATLDTGLTEFPLVGDAWSDTETRMSRVLKDFMEVERGFIFLGRSGRLTFRNREFYNTGSTPDYSINIDSQGNIGAYRYGAAEITSVSLTYYPSGETENEILWETRARKLVKARRRRRVQAVFEYEEGSKKTVKAINPFGSGGTDSTISAVDESGNPYDSKYYTAQVELRNGKGRITVYNTGPIDARFTITLKGTVEIPADSEQVQVVTDDTTKDLRDISIDNRLLKDEESAVDLGNYLIATQSNDYDEFTSLEIGARDNTWLDRQLNLTNGTLVSISEFQTAVSNKLHIVMGASHSWTPGHLISTFSLSRIDETDYWILGTSHLSSETVLGY